MSETKDPRRILDELRKLACDINEEEIRSHSVITLNQGRYNRQFRLDRAHDLMRELGMHDLMRELGIEVG